MSKTKIKKLRLRPRKTVAPAEWRPNYWSALDKRATSILSSDGNRLYEAEKALLWRQGYSWADAEDKLMVSIWDRVKLEAEVKFEPLLHFADEASAAVVEGFLS